MTNPKPERPVPVAAISTMDTVTFAKHMTARHKESLGGMGELPATIQEYDEGLYRSFHKRLHETRVGLEHEHDRGDQGWQDQR